MALLPRCAGRASLPRPALLPGPQVQCPSPIPQVRRPHTVRVLCSLAPGGSDRRGTASVELPFSAGLSTACHQAGKSLSCNLNSALRNCNFNGKGISWTQQVNSVRMHASPSGSGGGSAGGGAGGGGGGGGGDNNGGGDGPEQGDDEGQEKILSLKEVEALCEAQNIKLPADMLEVAAKYGLRASVLSAYISAASGGLLTSLIARNIPYLRDRILADKLFLFKVGAEVLIDSGCATVAEVRKRGEHFWTEFEFYLSDLVVGLVLDVALVSLMAPAAVLGGVSRAAMSTGWLAKALATIPSAFFEASVPGVKTYSLGSRFACLGVKFLEYSLAGIVCGLVGQGFCNGLMHLKRHLHGTSEDDVPVPPLVKTALVWGLFMGVSSNLRYQIVFGLERLVDLTIAKAVPPVAYGTTVTIRFVNNVIGGENFIDMARWAGVQ